MPATIKDLEAEHYTAISGECRCSLKMISFKMLRRQGWKIDKMTIPELASQMMCRDCGQRPFNAKPWRQEDAKGYASRA